MMYDDEIMPKKQIPGCSGCFGISLLCLHLFRQLEVTSDILMRSTFSGKVQTSQQMHFHIFKDRNFPYLCVGLRLPLLLKMNTTREFTSKIILRLDSCLFTLRICHLKITIFFYFFIRSPLISIPLLSR